VGRIQSVVESLSVAEPAASLRELPRVQQVPGEPRRRWFHGHEMDLVVWEDAEGALLGFQLAYDKHRNEHSIEWRAGRGFAHYQVDDGEAVALSKETPFLYPRRRIRATGCWPSSSPRQAACRRRFGICRRTVGRVRRCRGADAGLR
jgi:hypothetical protein